MTRRRLASASMVLGVLGVVAGAGAIVLAASGPHGPGLTMDSVSYLLGADSYEVSRERVGEVLNGVFPPGYSLSIAVAGLVVDDTARAALLVNIAALAGSLLLVATGVRRARRSHLGAASGDDRMTAVAVVATTAVVAFSTPVLRWSSAVMSELVSIFLVLAAVRAADRAARHGSLPWWAAAGALAGAASLVRLVALGSAIGLGLAALLVVTGSWRHRVLAAATAGAAAVATSFVGTSVLAGSVRSRRTFAWHPPDLDDARQAMDTVAEFVLPSGLGTTPQRAIAVGVVIGALVWAALLLRRVVQAPRSVPPLVVLAVAVAGAHVATVLAAMAVLDDLTPLDDRILLPAFPLVVLAVGAAASVRLPGTRPAVASALAVVVLVGQAGRIVEWTQTVRDEGMGYAHVLFDGSETLRVVRELPDDVLVWSNDISLLYLRADRTAAQLPATIDGYTGRRAADYEAGLERLRQTLDEGAVVVYVDYFPFPNTPRPAELEAEVGPLEVQELSDGIILRRASGPAG